VCAPPRFIGVLRCAFPQLRHPGKNVGALWLLCVLSCSEIYGLLYKTGKMKRKRHGNGRCPIPELPWRCAQAYFHATYVATR
jgi:hypothetical protein